MNSGKAIDLTGRGDVGSILVVRLFALGDIVLTLPLISLMRRTFPGAWIGYLVRERYAGALAGDTGLDEVISLPESVAGQLSTMMQLRRRRPDVAIDLLSNPRSAVLTRLSGARLRIGMDTRRRNGYYHAVLPRTVTRGGERVMMYTAESNLELGRMLGMDPAGSEYSFPAADGAAAEAEAFVASLGDSGAGLAGIVPAATYPSKSWPAGRFVELARRISGELGMRPVIMWGPGEDQLAAEIASAVPGAAVPPPTGIAGAGALIKRMKVLVGIDSGPKHLAVLLGVPTVTLFGPTDPRIWDPMDGKHRVVWKGLECARGCREKHCSPNRCMEMITVQEVFAEVSDLAGGGK